MVDVAPFRALRYAKPSRSNSISNCICPPYDVISLAEREELAQRSSANVVQLELPSGTNGDKYQNAARLLQEWRGKGVLQEEPEPCFYLLETRFRIKDPFAPSSKLKRYGVLAALRSETPGKGSIHPHEKTLPKAKEDRLNLLSAMRTNVSPIFGLFFDTEKKWRAWVNRVVKKKPTVIGSEKKDLEHRLWKIDDPRLQKEFRALLKSKPLYIADGHHRYEVSWAYKELRLKESPASGLTHGWHRVMTYICPMEEKGLLMLPTHRLVKTAKSFQEWKNHLEKFFDIEPVKGLAAIIKVLSKSPLKKRTIGWVHQTGSFLLTLKKGISIDRCLAHRPSALRELDVVVLHDLAFGEAPGAEFLTEKQVVYTRNIKEIQDTVNADSAWVAFLLASPGVESLARVAKASEVMPPKTTYFYPKVPTGFTMMSVEQEIL